MSCYMRHLRWLFEALDLEYDKANRARVDAAVRTVFDMPADAGCPEVWAAVKCLAPAGQWCTLSPNQALPGPPPCRSRPCGAIPEHVQAPTQPPP